MSGRRGGRKRPAAAPAPAARPGRATGGRRLAILALVVIAGAAASLAFGLFGNHPPVVPPQVASAPATVPPALPLAPATAPPPTPRGAAVPPSPPAAPAPDRPPAGPDEPPLPRVDMRPAVTVAALPPLPLPPTQPASAPASAAPAAAPAVAPQAPPPAGEMPAWRRYAVSVAPAAGRPMIAIIIDDMGLDRRRSEEVLDLPGPLTMSFMSYATGLARMTELARSRGDELMVHVPMEPLDPNVDPGPGALLERLPAGELNRRIEAALAAFAGYVGINNHEGSKFTAFAPGMTLVMEALRARGLLFIDSRTTGRSVGLPLAREMGVPAAGRDVFLDDVPDPQAVRRQLDEVERVARRLGSAIAIGHPKDATVLALSGWLPTLAARGFELVPVSAVVRSRIASSGVTPVSLPAP